MVLLNVSSEEQGGSSDLRVFFPLRNRSSFGTVDSQIQGAAARRWQKAAEMASLSSMQQRTSAEKCHERKSVSEILRLRTSAIGRLRRKGHWEKALSLLFGGPQDLVLFSAAASVCAKATAWRQASSLLDELKKRSLPPDVVFWSSLGAAYSSVGKWQLALWTLLDAPKAAGLEPNVVSYSSAMTACERASFWEKVLSLLEEVEGLPEKANAFSYSSAIVACGQVESSGWQLSLHLWSHMASASITPNVVAFNSTLTALERASCWQLACSLLEEFEDKDFMPDAVSYSAVATACPWQLGLLWLLRARAKAMICGPGAWSCLARKMGHSRAWQTAAQLLELQADGCGELWCSVMWAMEVT